VEQVIYAAKKASISGKLKGGKSISIRSCAQRGLKDQSKYRT